MASRAQLKFDGGSRGNPGPSAYAYVLTLPDGTLIRHASVLPDPTTNNYAEYAGMYEGVVAAKEAGVRELDIFGDSMLVICHLNGTWQCKKPHLRQLLWPALKILSHMDWTATHVPREMNSEADVLLNGALDAQR